jgi:dTDP-4-amino-4,6-dideoxygalactose transaminase
LQNNLVPVYVDIDLGTYVANEEMLVSAIGPKTKAIMMAHTLGNAFNLDLVTELAKKHGLWVIEDTCDALGGTYKGAKIGSFGDLSTLSFYPAHHITTGEGGAVSSPNPELLARAKSFSRQGLVRDPNKFLIKDEGPWHQEVHEFGLNYRLPDILCALGISQLSRIIQFKEMRMDIFNSYRSLLSHIDNLRIPIVKSFVVPMWHLYPVRVSADSRKKVFEGLRTAGIGVQVNYLPAHLHPIFTKHGHRVGQFPVSELFYSQQISLPMHVGISKKEIDYISETLLNLISHE